MIDKDKHSMDDSEGVEAYLHYVSKYKALSNAETMDLFRRYWKGEQQAFSLIAEGHLHLVIKIASSFKDCGIPIGDLIQEGNMGLLLAISQFKESHEGTFVCYANLCIYQSIKEAIEKLPLLIRFPHNQLDIHREVQKFKDNAEHCVGYRPSLDLVFDRDKSSAEKIAYYDLLPENLQDICEIQDLDSFADLSNYSEDKSDLSIIEPYLKILSDREKYILMSFCSGESLDSIGRELNLSKERIRQLINSSVKKIKSYIEVRKQTEVQSFQPSSYEAIGFGLNNQACKLPKGSVHKPTKKNTLKLHKEKDGTEHVTNDYDMLSHQLQVATSSQKECPESNHAAGNMEQEPKSLVTLDKSISVGDRIKYNTLYYTVDARVLEINTKRNKLVIQYENGVIDEVDITPEQIQIIG